MSKRKVGPGEVPSGPTSVFRRRTGAVRPPFRLLRAATSGYFAGATATCMKSPCALTLFTVIVVPVFGTFTLYQPGW